MKRECVAQEDLRSRFTFALVHKSRSTVFLVTQLIFRRQIVYYVEQPAFVRCRLPKRRAV